jgi:photosystem II stability/assembly factor-like uncharacterized protein
MSKPFGPKLIKTMNRTSIRALALCGSLGLVALQAQAQRKPRPAATPAAVTTTPDTTGKFSSKTLGGLKFRNIGPAVTGGRIGEVVVDPTNKSIWYLAVHSGGVWKTINAGTTWTPIFDSQASYSIGTVALDPKNPLVVWVGTGENNSQRSVGFGDGVYKSTDGGKNWANLGLKTSEHIGAILVDPRNGDVAYVAATGPLWSPGGERGVYKTTDGGKSWTLVLKPDNEWTGAQSLAMDPMNPDVIYASLHQRARRQWGFVDGGPGSGLYQSTDGGTSWTKLTRGLPNEELGKIGVAVSPADRNVVYAVVEAANRAGGIFRSTDAGQNWEKMSGWSSTAPMYYGKVYPDPKDRNRIYLMDTFLSRSDDGGRTVRSIQTRTAHVDHHALWIDPSDTEHLILGNDGGLYESFDGSATWNFKGNLSLTQFYRVDVDNALPFYNVCGGTQDNNSLCGPSATINDHGATNFDWFIIVGGDGFQARIDPEDPEVIYGEWQHGELVRFDRKTGERTEIQPQPEKGEILRWHWDTPLLISPHSHSRLYFAAQRLFRSDDRGNSWRAVSPDLSRQIDRTKLKLMGRVQSVDAISRNTSTSFFGTIVSFAESPKQEGLLYAGTDDGLIQVSEDGGGSWRRIDAVPGVPDTTFVSDLEPSRHDPNVVYASFNNHKAGDYKPYLLRSPDRGRTWTSIAGNLPTRGPVWAVAEDHVDPNLLFAGTEFGVFVTVDGGKRWVRLEGGLPTIPVRDLAIQRRENDLVLATFGRGFYVLDDYSPLRKGAETVERTATLLPVEVARMYVPASPLGGGPKGSQGDALWTSPNPAFGANFTYYLKDPLKSARAKRQEAEKDSVKKKVDPVFPTWDQLRAEDREEAPAAILTVSDERGNLIRRLTGPAEAGFHRIAWDLRYPPPDPVTGSAVTGFFDQTPTGPLVTPGRYQVELALRVGGVETAVGRQSFVAQPIRQDAVPVADRTAIAAFHEQTASLARAAFGAGQALGELENRLGLLTQASELTARAPAALRDSAQALKARLRDLRVELSGDQTVGSRQEPVPPTIEGRIRRVVGGTWSHTGAPTATHRRSYQIASEALGTFLPTLRAAADALQRLGEEAERAGVPWTPGRIPTWRTPSSGGLDSDDNRSSPVPGRRPPTYLVGRFSSSIS